MSRTCSNGSPVKLRFVLVEDRSYFHWYGPCGPVIGTLPIKSLIVLLAVQEVHSATILLGDHNRIVDRIGRRYTIH
ncbi:hypothetical protein D3C86_1683130 [compost metagenome]